MPSPVAPSTLPAGFLLFALAAGCSRGPFNAPPGSRVSLTPSERLVVLGSFYCTSDLQGVMGRVDAQVVNSNGDALDNIYVEIFAEPGIYVLPPEALKLVEYPEAPADYEQQYASVCDNGSGGIQAGAPDWCVWYYDAVAGDFYDFNGEYADAYGTTDSGVPYVFRPDYYKAVTNSAGLASFWYFVDQLPASSSSEEEGSGDTSSSSSSECDSSLLGNSTMLITIGVDSSSFDIRAGGS